MEPNARKIFANFEDDVKHAKMSGTCSHKLWFFIYLLAEQWKNRTDRIESCNSLIKRQTRDAPRISLELLSSRLMLKYKMESAGVQQKTFTWRTNHQIMSNILGDIVDHTDDAAGYLYSGDEGRWAECEPLPLKDMPHSQVLRLRPALGTPIGDGNFDIGDVQPHEMARCKAWAKRVSHEIRTQLRTWLREDAGSFGLSFPSSLALVIGNDAKETFVPIHLGQMLFLRCSHQGQSDFSIVPSTCDLVRFDLVVQTLYTEVMTYMDLPRKSTQRQILDKAISIRVREACWENGVGTVLPKALETLPSLADSSATMTLSKKQAAENSSKKGKAISKPPPMQSAQPVPIENGMERTLEEELESVMGAEDALEEPSDCDDDIRTADGAKEMQDAVNRLRGQVHVNTVGAGDVPGDGDCGLIHAHEEARFSEQLQSEHPDLAARQQNLIRLEHLQHVEEYVNTYCTGVRESWPILQRAIDAWELPPGHNGQMSIVKHPMSGPSFFHWMNPPLTGRLVRLDKDQRPVWPVSSQTQMVKFDDAFLQNHPSCSRHKVHANSWPAQGQRHKPQTNHPPRDLRLLCQVQCRPRRRHDCALASSMLAVQSR